MLRSKAFVKVTNKGSVVKVVREHYLRDDIGCGVKGCPSCPLASDNIILLDPIEGKQAVHKTVDSPRIIVPDTNIFLHHLDVMETEGFQDVIVLQTVLDEVRNRSPSIYHRIRSLLNRLEKRFYVFSNEHHRETYAGDAQPGESSNDRNDRAIRMVAAWYLKHLSVQGSPFDTCSIVLLTNDAGNREKASFEDAKYKVFSLSRYCEGLIDHPSILEMLESANDDNFVADDGILYGEEYLSSAQVQDLLNSGKALKGTLHTSSYNPMEGVVLTGLEGSGELNSIQVVGRSAMNRAVHGDSVAIILLSKDEHQQQINHHVDVAVDEGQVMAEIVPDEADNTSASRPKGKIIAILNRKWKAYCGSIDRRGIRPDAPVQHVLFCPMDRRIPRIRIRTRQAEQLATQRILVAIDGWSKTSAYPHGHLVRQLGPTGDRATETEAILLEYDVAHADWTPQVLSCLPELGDKWLCESDQSLSERADLRHLDVCSIDPPGCTDIDDALHARLLPNGNFEVGVHIADVTHFVNPNTPLDIEAAARGTTVYLVDRRIDMLPSLLGTNLCSLKSNVERFAFSCIWEMTSDAEIVNTKFMKSVISSKASFTYDQAQERLDDPKADENDPLTKSIRSLNGLAMILKARRIDAGALTLASPEVRFQLDRETQNPLDVELKEMKAANSLVEEFMLLANISVAKQLYQHFPDTSILRRHPAPPADNFEALNKALAARNESWVLDTSSSKALAVSLDKATDPDDPYLNKLVRIMTTRCMLQAQYFASGTLSYQSFWHYGLACPIYTHFTSPIRRYSDVLVHRLLFASIDQAQRGSAINWDKARGEDLCNNLNYRHRMAQQAQRSSVELFTQLYFKGKNITTDAYVLKTMPAAIVVLIPQYGIEGMVPLPEDKLAPGISYDPTTGSFVSHSMDSQQAVLGLFQHVQISIKTVAHEISQREKIVIGLVDPAILRTKEIDGPATKRSKPSP